MHRDLPLMYHEDEDPLDRSENQDRPRWHLFIIDFLLFGLFLILSAILVLLVVRWTRGAKQ